MPRKYQCMPPIPFIVLKALAYENRRERKDVYDLIYVLLHCEKSPTATARLITEGERSAGSFHMATDALRRHFETPQHCGAVDYARFLENPGHEAVNAFATVQEFIQALGEDRN